MKAPALKKRQLDVLDFTENEEIGLLDIILNRNRNFSLICTE
jgi:hypothetical protein